MQKIEIVIVENDKLYTDNLLWYLSANPELKCAETFSDAKSAFHFLKRNPTFRCDVILLDLGLEHEDGLDYIEDFLSVRENVKIIVLSIAQDEEKIIKAIKLGAIAFVSKRDVIEELAKTIMLATVGKSSFSPSIANELVHHFKKVKGNKQMLLTKRQQEILEKFAEGKSYKEVASELFIGVETVRSHTKAIYRTLKVKNKLEALKLIYE